MIDPGQIAHEILLKLRPELAHKIGMFGMQHGIFAPGEYDAEKLPLRDFFDYGGGVILGLAAGFDKNGYLMDKVQEYGFGWVEVGSITWEGGKGNKKPRLFRLKNEFGERSLLNRMGLNGDPAVEVCERLCRAKRPFAVNIAKTHNPKIVGDEAITDIQRTYREVVGFVEPEANVIYVVLNISCPNTTEGKTFEDNPESLDELLSAVAEFDGKRPILLKVSPTLTLEKAKKIVEIADDRVGGYICANTLPFEHPQYGRGGASGVLVQPYTLQTIKMFRELTKKIIIGCGGIESGVGMMRAERSGANLFQTVNGLVVGRNHGPSFAHRVLDEYCDLKKQEGN